MQILRYSRPTLFEKKNCYFFKIRQLQLDRVRKIYGRALGEYGKDKIFLAYAALELSLGNIDRCRTIHAKFIEKHPTSTKAWISFIDFEINLEEYERGKALCEIAIDLNTVTLPEMVINKFFFFVHLFYSFSIKIWKKYIDIEANQGEHQRVRDLYERLLKISQHYKVNFFF
jgi:crooked neck